MAGPRLLRYAVYRNMFLSFLLLTAAMIALVTAVLFSLFSWSAAREVGGISRSMLQQNSAVSSVVKNQVYNVANLLLNDKTVVSALYNRRDDPVANYHAVMKLRTVGATFPFIHSIGLYNGTTNTYLNTKGITLEQESELLHRIQSRNQTYFQLFPRHVPNRATGDDVRALTVVLLPSIYSMLPAKGAIVIDMDEASVQRLIGGYQNETADSLFVLGRDGTVLTHSQPERFMANLSGEPYVRNILESRSDNGYFIDRIDGEKSVVAFVKSPDLEWIFVSVSRYDQVLSHLRTLRGATLALAFACFLLSVFLSARLTNHAYNPIRGVLDLIASHHRTRHASRINEFDLLGHTYSEMKAKLTSLESSVGLARQAELAQLLKSGDPPAAERFADSLPGASHYVAIAVLFDDRDDPRSAGEDRRSAVEGACEAIWGRDGALAAAIEDGVVAIVLPLGSPQPPMDLAEALHELQRRLLQTRGLSATIGVGSVADSPEAIRLSFAQAETCFQERFFKGKGLIHYCDPLVKEQGGKRSGAAYPEAQEKRIVEAIKLQQRAKLDRLIDQWEKDVQGCHYHEAMFYIHQFLGALYKQVNVPAAKQQRHSDLYMEFHRRLPRYETLKEIADAMKQLAHTLCELAEDAEGGRHAEVVAFIQAYVQRHYAKPDLSLELVAGEVKLSRSYVGKLFKAHTDLSFNDYLNLVRLEKARDLLAETNDPIQSISERVGIHNTTYFYTLFRKHYQVSPAQYRSLRSIREERAQ